jgi:hypothetical protein
MNIYIKLNNELVESYAEAYFEDSILIEISEDNYVFLRKNFPFVKYINKDFIIDKSFKDNIENKNNKLNKIDELKIKLSSTDYKITKCYEAFMRQQPLPYNLEELSAQRDAWRAEINQLEQELKTL